MNQLVSIKPFWRAVSSGRKPLIAHALRFWVEMMDHLRSLIRFNPGCNEAIFQRPGCILGDHSPNFMVGKDRCMWRLDGGNCMEDYRGNKRHFHSPDVSLDSCWTVSIHIIRKSISPYYFITYGEKIYYRFQYDSKLTKLFRRTSLDFGLLFTGQFHQKTASCIASICLAHCRDETVPVTLNLSWSALHKMGPFGFPVTRLLPSPKQHKVNYHHGA